MTRRRGVGAVAALLAVLFGLGCAAFASWGTERVERVLSEPATLRSDFPVTVDVPRGASAAAIARFLEGERLVSDARILRAWLAAAGLSGRLQAGEYAIERPLSVVDLSDFLVSGRVVLHSVTVPEGLTLEETASKLAASGLWTEKDLLAAFHDPSSIRHIDADAPDLEGYLFPDTYNFPRGEAPVAVARAMTDRFRQAFGQARWVDARVEHVSPSSVTAGPPPDYRSVVTLASLVEKETALPAEYALVASVYANRLRIGMRLECDPTVITALRKDGLWMGGPLTHEDLSHPSPWNTYVVAGLPPGPIASPGLGALHAALHPAETEYLYFVATGDGGHRFAASYAEHLRNVSLLRRFEREAAATAAAGGGSGAAPASGPP